METMSNCIICIMYYVKLHIYKSLKTTNGIMSHLIYISN